MSRTTSTFTTSAEQTTSSSGAAVSSRSSGGDGDGWNTYSSSNGGGFSEQSTLGGGFGNSENDNNDQPTRPTHRPQASATGSVVIPPGTGEAVVVTMLPEKEGMFLFQHRNYEVRTVRRGSTVVRRYSDFVWLLDCLQKRYPFRRLPLLPPKRVQGWFNHFSSSG